MAATHLKVITMVLVFLFGGEVKIEKKSFPTAEACIEAANARIEEIQKDPRFESGITAVCVEEQGAKS